MSALPESLKRNIQDCVRRGKIYYSKTRRCRKRCKPGTVYYRGRCKNFSFSNNNNPAAVVYAAKSLKNFSTGQLIEELKRRIKNRENNKIIKY